LPLRDVFSNGFSSALYGFGIHLEPGQQFDLQATVIEGGGLTDHRQHAPYAGRELGFDHVQFGIGGELPMMAVATQIVRALPLHLA
jgi:hypothetical protein